MRLATVGLSGPVLRYAEVVRQPDRRLRRLGAVYFEFDAERAVFAEDDPGGLQAVASALEDVFDGAALDALVVAAHPTVTTSFFTPLPSGMPAEARTAQLNQEAALLSDASPTRVVRVHAAPVRAEGGGGTTWYQVVHVDDPVHVRLALLADALGVPSYDVVDAARAASALTEAAGVVLSVGAYKTHTEAAVVRDGTFLFSHHGPGTEPADTAYFALAALQQAGLDPADVGELVAYGDAARGGRLSVVADLLGRTPRPADPLAPFQRKPEGEAAEIASFAPALGAALG